LSEQDGLRDFHVSRLDFLRYSLATGVVVWSGSRVSGMDEAEAQELFGAAAVDPGIFPQSVASGDPKPNGIVLWTRLRPPSGGGPARVGYRVALDDDRTDAEAFRDPVLSGVAETSAARDYTVKVQLQRAELKPFRRYRYRFYYGGSASRTGRFRTLPAPSADVGRIRFGYISCQDYTNGYYNALYHLAKERDLDFVVHLGDYTYETVSSDSFQGGGPEERQFVFPDGGDEQMTLRDYRFGYKKYKTDPNLQRLHEKCAFIMIWDDHEFANDAYQVFAPDQGGTDDTPSKNPRRREVASRAWAEFNPVGVYYNPANDPLNEIVIYRSFEFGNLMELVMTDQRLYRDPPPNGNETQDRYVTPGTGRAGEEAPGRTMLGDGTPGVDGLRRPPQVNYFLQKVTRSPRRWKIWGNEVTFMQLKVANASLGSGTVSSLEDLFPGIADFPAGQAVGNAPEGVYITLDQWDGFQAERRRITQRLRDDRTLAGPAGVENFVTITGDIHSYIAGYIKTEYDDPTCMADNRPIGVELVCPSVTSSNLSEIATLGFGAAPAPDVGEFTAQVEANNPHIKFFNSNEHGYNLMEVTKDSILCTMKAIRTAPSPENPNANGIREDEPQKTRAAVLRRFRVPAGEVLLVDETGPVPVPLPCGAPAPSPGAEA
jgi:alkaline phosphatase D